MSRQQFFLVSPVTPPIHINQKFGEHPEDYARFDLPGHEGLDLRAVTGAPIFAAQAGRVALVADGPAYGHQIRIEHTDWLDGVFVTIYAHLVPGSEKIKQGDYVNAGQLIALADSTGNSTGSHLHLSLKHRGVSNGGYGEFVDPLPYLEPALTSDQGGTAKTYFVDVDPGLHLHVRQQPNLTAEIIGDLERGSEVTAIAFDNGFAHLTAPAGWAYMKYLSETKPIDPPAPAGQPTETSPAGH